jgi:acyl-CoA synthetase (AMP-forming)/AMP-acid ligase II
MSSLERAWLGRVPRMRHERHYGDRIVRCFVERPKNAYDLLRDAAARNGQGEAIVCGNERLTYHELESAVEQCAAGLKTAGIGKGDRVAMLLGNGIPFPIVLFAALRIGAVAVPMSVREQTQGLAHMLAHSGASIEVENALMSFPGVVEAAAVAQPCAVLGERVHAFVVASDVGVLAADLKRHCASLLADYKVPEIITLRDQPLPRNAYGKLLKRNLRAEATSAGE